MATVVLAIVIGGFGILILGGGIWLIVLGGSWYYAVAGAGLCITAWLLAQQSMAALWVYLATFAFTAVWAIWEKGFDGWAQVPRLVAPTVVLILLLLTLPVLRRRDRQTR
ncbi:MAG: glucose dehydrogenase [Phyllobacteriaceae bacterium]|nr:glucose dehydrogenase [Phyllobacteriaceae bacterium]MBA90268.1 glucose dehydrogenase [Phyllobacteriaceae bacterium]